MSALVLGVLLVATDARAVTEAQKQTAILNALSYLASTQQADGRWVYSGGVEDGASTASALLAFMEAKQKLPGGGPDYSAVISKGVTYLMNQATAYNISNEPTGNPDSNGNGIGVKFVPGGNNPRDTYVTGLVLPVLSYMPANGVVTTGSQAGRTYKQVVQDVVDYFAYGQADPGNTARGGWRYYADYGQSDNSTAQWPAIGMLFAESRMGVTPPQFVRDELKYWVDYIQNNSNGGSGYDSPTYLVNEAKTGGLLVEMYVCRTDQSSVAYDINHPDVQAAIAYLNSNWQDGPNATWDGNFAHPYAMWSVYKGLELYLGTKDNPTDGINDLLTNMHPQGGAVLDTGDLWNWWEDYCEWIVSNQTAAGNWAGYTNWTGPMAAGWYVNILAATQVQQEQPPIPEPLTILAVCTGVGMVGSYLRRRARC
jgi:hypothetical protein